MVDCDFNLVLKYCEALDEFVRIRVFGESELRNIIDSATLADKEAYQRRVIDACILDYNRELCASLEEIKTSGGLPDIEDLLYLLSIDVNPSLEIHQVTVPLTMSPDMEEQDLFGPVPRKPQKQLDRIMVIDGELKRRIIGQDKAVDIVCRAVKKAAVGLRDPRRPVGTFLLVGHVGVGKTELAKAISEYLYGNQSHLIRVDCSEYALPHEYAKLIGSPPGYIGHNEGGYLTEAAKELDEFVVLFDEIEKAHSKMHNILLQLLDEGMVTDSKGFKVSFRNALVLMTSNIGVREVEDLRRHIGFDYSVRQEPSYEEMSAEITEALKKEFRPEFLNRLDDCIVFNTLTMQDSIRISALLLKDLSRIARRAGVLLTFDPCVKKNITERGFRRECGARELKRTIKTLLETPLTDLILEGEITEGMVVRVNTVGGEMNFSPQKLAEEPLSDGA